MNFFNLFKRSNPPTPPRKAARSFINAASITRLTGDFAPPTITADSVLRQEVGLIRDRARLEEWNNDYARSFYGAIERNVVGSDGFSFTPQVLTPRGKLDKDANAIIYDKWMEWCRLGNCTVDGELSFIDVQKMLIRSAARDGGILIRKRIGPQYGPFNFQLQLLEIDLLDLSLNTSTEGGFISLGTEKTALGKPIKYHLLGRHPGQWLVHGNELRNERRVVIGAEELLHYFVKERVIQSIGVPWLVSGATRSWHLSRYEEAEVMAARAGAEKGGWFESETGETFTGEQQTNPDGTTNTLVDFEPQSFDELPKGTKFVPYMPNHPNDAFPEFRKACIHGIAAGSGMGMTYGTLTGDMSEANYSSMRAGKLEEQEGYKTLQRHLIEHAMCGIFNSFLEVQLMTRGLGEKYGPQDFSRLKTCMIRGRRWPWVDPEKDVAAAEKAITLRIKSRTQLADEAGTDYEQTLMELDAEEQAANAKGLSISSGLRPMAEAYSILTKSGGVTASREDEDRLRQLAGLPPASDEVKASWDESEGVRLPATGKPESAGGDTGTDAPEKNGTAANGAKRF